MSEIIVCTYTRYGGIYEGCEYVAYLTDNVSPSFPYDSMGGDTDCCAWWSDDSNTDTVGTGDSLSEAVSDLRQKTGTTTTLVQEVDDIRGDLRLIINAEEIVRSYVSEYNGIPDIDTLMTVTGDVVREIDYRRFSNRADSPLFNTYEDSVMTLAVTLDELAMYATEEQVKELLSAGMEANYYGDLTVRISD